MRCFIPLAAIFLATAAFAAPPRTVTLQVQT
jgi:hypothetical protein